MHTNIIKRFVSYIYQYFFANLDPEEEIPYQLEISRIAKSTGTVSPGDFIFFQYPVWPYDKTAHLAERFVLVVRTKRASQGLFWSTRQNLLLTCFKLPYWNEQIMTAIIKRLHKNRRKCSYRSIIKGMSALLGLEAFRTYDTKKMQHFQEITVVKPEGAT